MRKETEELRLNHLNIFSLDRLNTLNNFESGTNITLGFDYKMEKDNKELDFSVGQSINADENSSMPSSLVWIKDFLISLEMQLIK